VGHSGKDRALTFADKGAALDTTRARRGRRRVVDNGVEIENMVAPYGICDPEMTKLFIPPMPRSRAQEGPPKASTTKCGQCHTCLNPQLKKACITFRKEQGLPPPTRKKKDGDAAVTATPAAAGALGDDTTASEGNEQPKRVYAPRVDHWAAEKGWKPRKWRKVDVHNDTLLHNNTCKLKRWAPGGCQILRL
jgi:hypothetical protein